MPTLQQTYQKAKSKLLSHSVRRARRWSNEMLRQHAPLIQGTVVNASGWRDEDKEGKHYKDYFTGATGYAISNFEGWRGVEDDVESITLDLTAPLDPALDGAYDCVFNHTTIEHIFEVRKAFANLCRMSRNALIIVAPAAQPTHGPEDGDFWRFTPYAMRHLLAENGFTILYEDFGPELGVVKYSYYFAVRDASAWAGKVPQTPEERAQVVKTSRRLAV